MHKIYMMTNLTFIWILKKTNIISDQVTWSRDFKPEYKVQAKQKPVYFNKKSQN